VDGVKALRLGLGQLDQAQAQQAQPGGLDHLDDTTDGALGHGVWFHDAKSPFNCHVQSLFGVPRALKNIASSGAWLSHAELIAGGFGNPFRVPI